MISCNIFRFFPHLPLISRSNYTMASLLEFPIEINLDFDPNFPTSFKDNLTLFRHIPSTFQIISRLSSIVQKISQDKSRFVNPKFPIPDKIKYTKFVSQLKIIKRFSCSCSISALSTIMHFNFFIDSFK